MKTRIDFLLDPQIKKTLKQYCLDNDLKLTDLMLKLITQFMSENKL